MGKIFNCIICIVTVTVYIVFVVSDFNAINLLETTYGHSLLILLILFSAFESKHGPVYARNQKCLTSY